MEEWKTPHSRTSSRLSTTPRTPPSGSFSARKRELLGKYLSHDEDGTFTKTPQRAVNAAKTRRHILDLDEESPMERFRRKSRSKDAEIIGMRREEAVTPEELRSKARVLELENIEQKASIERERAAYLQEIVSMKEKLRMEKQVQQSQIQELIRERKLVADLRERGRLVNLEKDALEAEAEHLRSILEAKEETIQTIRASMEETQGLYREESKTLGELSSARNRLERELRDVVSAIHMEEDDPDSSLFATPTRERERTSDHPSSAAKRHMSTSVRSGSRSLQLMHLLDEKEQLLETLQSREKTLTEENERLLSLTNQLAKRIKGMEETSQSRSRVDQEKYEFLEGRVEYLVEERDKLVGFLKEKDQAWETRVKELKEEFEKELEEKKNETLASRVDKKLDIDGAVREVSALELLLEKEREASEALKREFLEKERIYNDEIDRLEGKLRDCEIAKKDLMKQSKGTETEKTSDRGESELNLQLLKANEKMTLLMDSIARMSPTSKAISIPSDSIPKICTQMTETLSSLRMEYVDMRSAVIVLLQKVSEAIQIEMGSIIPRLVDRHSPHSDDRDYDVKEKEEENITVFHENGEAKTWKERFERLQDELFEKERSHETQVSVLKEENIGLRQTIRDMEEDHGKAIVRLRKHMDQNGEENSQALPSTCGKERVLEMHLQELQKECDAMREAYKKKLREKEIELERMSDAFQMSHIGGDPAMRKKASVLLRLVEMGFTKVSTSTAQLREMESLMRSIIEGEEHADMHLLLGSDLEALKGSVKQDVEEHFEESLLELEEATSSLRLLFGERYAEMAGENCAIS
eukprot:TRINITY_DN3421_c1_g1_i1.p1 TRINITY_DN3421_c1_g1~~TRINITY_DN3421_c1_g1_i1.p1  ORF type:complete len:816 (+),score=310.84 TRINITY_DN3421_c1_g1_i1:180-2627(+)